MPPMLMNPNDPNGAVSRVAPMLTLMQNGGGGGGGAPTPTPAPAGADPAAGLMASPEAEGFLDPDALKRLRSLALMNMGAQIMGGASGPKGTLNMGRDVSNALQSGQGMYQQMIDRMMQQRQWELQFGGYQALQKAMQQFPMSDDESPLDSYRRYQQMADYVAQNAPGPVGMQLAGQLMEMGNKAKSNLPDIKQIDNVPGDPQMPGYKGDGNYTQMVDSRSGRVLWQFPFHPNLDPEQRGNLELQYHRAAMDYMNTMEPAAVAAKNYKSLGNTPMSDNLRLQYARAIFMAHGGGNIDPQQGQMLDQLLEAIKMAPHQLSPDSRAELDRQVNAALPDLERLSNAEYKWHRARNTSYGFDVTGLYDPFAAPTPQPGQSPIPAP